MHGLYVSRMKLRARGALRVMLLKRERAANSTAVFVDRQGTGDAIAQRDAAGAAELVLQGGVAGPGEDAFGLIGGAFDFGLEIAQLGGDPRKFDEGGVDAGGQIDGRRVVDLVHGVQDGVDAIFDVNEVAHLASTPPHGDDRVTSMRQNAFDDAGEWIGIVLVLAVTGEGTIADGFEAVFFMGQAREVFAGELSPTVGHVRHTNAIGERDHVLAQQFVVVFALVIDGVRGAGTEYDIFAGSCGDGPLPVMRVDGKIVGHGERVVFDHLASPDHGGQMESIIEGFVWVRKEPVTTILRIIMEVFKVQRLEKGPVGRWYAAAQWDNRVDTMHFMAFRQQAGHYMPPDKSGTTGD